MSSNAIHLCVLLSDQPRKCSHFVLLAADSQDRNRPLQNLPSLYALGLPALVERMAHLLIGNPFQQH
jgi:hypothetical protein